MSRHISSDHSRSASRSSQTPRLSQGQAFEPMPRQSFGRNSRVPNPNVFADEYSLEPIDTDNQIERAPSPASISSSTTLRSIHHPQKTVGQATPENDNPFADDARVSFEEARRSSLPQKGMGGFSTNRGSVASVSNSPFGLQRNQSVSSRFSIPRAMSPYTGATGPSHPYAMYPQVGVSRSPSVASTSTIRQHDRPLGESSGPQHPYAMYSQNVVEEGMDDDVIPVGFPGHNPPYQPPPGRRDNDVGDIIGADGHAEPLPPYSRYPTGVVPKPPGVEMMADMNAPSETQQLHSISRDQHQPISETSTRALVPLSSGGTTAVDYDDDDDIRERRAPLTGIMAFEEKLKQKGKKTACCSLPVWTIVLVATVMLIGGSIGGAIGGVIGGKRAAEHDRQAAAQSSGPQIVTVTATPQMDYSTMTSTPTNLKSVPTGHYLVPAQLQNSSRMCVEDSQFRHAWGCMDNPTNFDVVVGGDNGHHSIIFSSAGPTSTFTYGAQPPILPTPTQSLGFAIDTSDTGLGPALFFFAKFDKLVIVPESQFESSSSSVSSRSFIGDDSFLAKLHRMQTAQPGDKPWFCYWNQTMMEFFIYVNQTIAADSGTTASTETDMAASTASAQSSKRGDSILDYPRKIKIEERRDFAGAQAPYCQQMQVGSDGHIVGPIQSQVINIKEREPTPTTTYINTSGGSQQTYTAKAQYATPCYCLSTTD